MKKLSKRKLKEIRFQTIIEIIMILLMFAAFVPIILMVIMSLKSNWDIISDFFGWPEKIEWANYSNAFGKLYQCMVNTLSMIVVAVFLTLILSMVSGYVFAVMKFPGKNLLFMLLLVLMMIPGILSLAANYNLIISYGLYNTRLALILPWISGGQILGIILCRNSIEGLPTDLFEAAKIEGCGEIQAMIKIATPLARPMLATIAVMKTVDYYNDFIWPMMVIESNTKQVITVAVKVFNAAQGTVNIGAMFAGYVVATIPLLILFLCTSRLYMEGMTAGAVKG